MTNKNYVSMARTGLNKSRIEEAKELNTESINPYRGDLTSKENGSLVKKMIEEYERNLIGK